MNVYVAGKFEEKELVRTVQRTLLERGHTITHDWTGEDATGMEGEQLEEYLADNASRDVDGVAAAEAVLILNHPKGFGMMAEMGMAIAWNIPIYVIGPQIRDCIFFHLPEVQGFDTIEDALEKMEADQIERDQAPWDDSLGEEEYDDGE